MSNEPKHPEQAEGAQGEPLPYWEPCNPACDPELNGFRDRKCSCEQASAVLAQPSPTAPELPAEDEPEAAGLGYPIAKEEAVKLWYAGFRSEVITVLEAWEAIGHDIGMNPDKGELLSSLRYMLEKCEAHDAAQARVAELEKQEPAAFRAATVISYRPGMGEVTFYVEGGVPGFMDIGNTIYVADHASVAPARQTKKWTYASEQETNCAGCGKRKHTPLRVDWMGGYVCLTCIDEKLEALHDAAQAGQVPEGIRVLLSPDMKQIFVPSLPDANQPRVVSSMAHWMCHWTELVPVSKAQHIPDCVLCRMREAMNAAAPAQGGE